jgi:hypothetical protein
VCVHPAGGRRNGAAASGATPPAAQTFGGRASVIAGVTKAGGRRVRLSGIVLVASVSSRKLRGVVVGGCVSHDDGYI